MQKLHISQKGRAATYAKIAQVGEKPMQKLQSSSGKNYRGDSAKIAQVPPDETRREQGPREGDNHRIDTSITKKIIDMRPSAGADAPVVDQKEKEQEEQPDLMTLRVAYTSLSHQLAQLDANKQAGQWARLYRQVQAAEAHVRQAEQATPPAIAESSEFAKQQEVLTGNKGAALLPADGPVADERQAQMRAVANDLLYWKGGLKVLKQARLPKWRGSFQWQIEAKIVDLQAEYARLRAQVADEG